MSKRLLDILRDVELDEKECSLILDWAWAVRGERPDSASDDLVTMRIENEMLAAIKRKIAWEISTEDLSR